VPIGRLSAGLAGLRIAHVSDFHFRSWTRVAQTAQELLTALDYDLLVGTGDFGTKRSHWRRAAGLMRRFFEPIADKSPMFAVLGNHDAPEMATDPSVPLEFLRNRSVHIEQHGSTLELAGMDQVRPGNEDIVSSLGAGRSCGLTILLAHYPSTVFRLPPGRVDLQLSGHTHGGQIRLPELGCLWPNDRIPRNMAWGLHRVAGTFLYVNAGIGVSPPIPARIDCPAEVSIITLEPSEQAERPLVRQKAVEASAP
jgi:hypothetical protein